MRVAGFRGGPWRVIEVSTGRRIWEGSRMIDAITFALDDRDRFQFDFEDRLLMGVAYWRDTWVGGLIKPEWKELVRGPSPVSVAQSLMAHHLGERRNQE